MIRGHTAKHLIILVLFITTLGCAQFDYKYRYTPRPVEIIYVDPNTQQTQVRALVTVIGIRIRDEHGHGVDPTVTIRMQLENDTSRTAYLQGQSVSVSTANLNQIPGPQPTLDEAIPIPPDQPVDLMLEFPITKTTRKRYDLEGLCLNWAVQLDEHIADRSVTFTRIPRYLYDPNYARYISSFGYGRPINIHRPPY